MAPSRGRRLDATGSMTASRETEFELPFGAAEGGVGEKTPLRVSELVGLVSDALDRSFASVLVAGEISKLTRATSGHCYFTLSDDDARIDAVMWRGDATRLGFSPAVGDEVVCRGRVGVYSPQGRMQLYATSMRPLGWGAAQRALEELKRKLAAEGLFAEERKRALPILPRAVGVVTSRAGAALHDILTTIHRRCRYCRVVISPALVQGDDAPRSLVAALRLLEEYGRCDVVIVGRGGGASEDLAAFNDEAVVRSVAGFPVPVVSAVGHEIDVTLCDLAADRRAATPTAAAELVVPVHAELVEQVRGLDARLRVAATVRVRHLRLHVSSAAGRLREPATRVAMERQRLDDMAIRLERSLVDLSHGTSDRITAMKGRLERAARDRLHALEGQLVALDGRLRRTGLVAVGTATTALATLGSKLDALSPLAVLDRGYSLAMRPDGALVRAANEIGVGDELTLRFARGGARTKVFETTEGGDS